MRRFAALAWLLLPLLTAACLGPRVVVEVAPEAGGAWIAPGASWDWASRPAPSVRAPEGQAAPLHARLRELLARALERRGFVHVEEGAELRVSYRLDIERSRRIVRTLRPARWISGSLTRGHYEVQGVMREERVSDAARLVVGVQRDSAAAALWVARYEQRHTDGFAPHLEGAVESLFERFPPPTGPLRAAQAGPYPSLAGRTLTAIP